MKRRDFLLGVSGFGLVACTKPEYSRATKAEADAAFFSAGPPYYISLESMVSSSSEASEHSGLLINGSQRVLYDPAGSYWVRGYPRYRDIHFGMTDARVKQYESFHARLGFYVEKQTKMVSKEVADLAILRAEAIGETYHLMCAVSASKVLQGLSGFESIGSTFSPDVLKDRFAKLDGVRTEYMYENDTGQNLVELEIDNFDPNDTAPPPKPIFGRGDFTS